MAKRRCIRRKTVPVLQSHGPAKRRKVCAAFAVGGKRGKSKWCVFKGKGKGRKTTCHTSKASAKHAAARLRKTCKSRIRVKRAK